MVNVIERIERWRLLERNAARRQPLIPAIHILCDEGDDHAWGRCTLSFAKAEKAICTDLIDATSPLIERQRQPEESLVKMRGGGQVRRVEKGDLLREGRRHRRLICSIRSINCQVYCATSIYLRLFAPFT
mgnify:CR=1 FL=1